MLNVSLVPNWKVISGNPDIISTPNVVRGRQRCSARCCLRKQAGARVDRSSIPAQTSCVTNDSALTVKLNESHPSTRIGLLQSQCSTLSASDGLRVVPQRNVGVGVSRNLRD